MLERPMFFCACSDMVWKDSVTPLQMPTRDSFFVMRNTRSSESLV